MFYLDQCIIIIIIIITLVFLLSTLNVLVYDVHLITVTGCSIKRKKRVISLLTLFFIRKFWTLIRLKKFKNKKEKGGILVPINIARLTRNNILNLNFFIICLLY